MKKKYLALLLVATVAFAQNVKPQDCIKNCNLEEVVVTANRNVTLKKETPIAIAKLTTQTIDQTKATAIFEIVNKIPGVLMVNLGNEQHTMSIRQPMTTNAYYLYLEDGLPIRPMGVFNHNALLEINQFNLQSIEVVKGPASSLYGPEAVGGAVNLISQSPTINPEMKFGVQANAFGYYRTQAMASATVGKFGFHISGLRSDQKNGWMAFSDYQKNNINTRLDYAFSDKTRLISTIFYGEYYSDMSGSVNAQDFFNRVYKSTTNFTYRKSKALRSRLTLEQDWSANAKSSVTAFVRNNTMEQNPSYAIKWSPNKVNATGEINSNNFKSYGLTAQHFQKINFAQTNLIIGGLLDYSPVNYWGYGIDLKANLNPTGQTVNNYEIIKFRPDNKIADYTATIVNTAGYIQVSARPLAKMILTGGLRYDNMNLNYDNKLDLTTGNKIYDQLTFKLGANYNLSDMGFYGNYSKGFSPPGITSIFRKKPGTGVLGIPASFYYNLEPAVFANYEIGGWFSFFSKKIALDYSIYYMTGKNELLNIRQPDGSSDTQSAGKTIHKGIEFGLNYKPNNSLHLRIGGTTARHIFQEFKISDNASDIIKNLDGLEMPSAPHWTTNSEINYYPKYLTNCRASLEWQWISSWYQDQINTAKYPGYHLFNARIGYKIKNIEAYLNLINIADKLYATSTSKGNKPTDVPAFTPAAPRTFMLGLQYNLSLKK